jgi:hypothetical protein
MTWVRVEALLGDFGDCRLGHRVDRGFGDAAQFGPPRRKGVFAAPGPARADRRRKRFRDAECLAALCHLGLAFGDDFQRLFGRGFPDLILVPRVDRAADLFGKHWKSIIEVVVLRLLGGHGAGTSNARARRVPTAGPASACHAP